MVMRLSGGGVPRAKHATLDEAIKEAGRLSDKELVEFYVLEAVGVSMPVRQSVYTCFDGPAHVYPKLTTALRTPWDRIDRAEEEAAGVAI
jgi:hypothetical protein